MALNLLAPFHFESLTYYRVIILRRIGGVNFCALAFSYTFWVLVFQSRISSCSRLIELNWNFEKNSGPKPKPDQIFSICHWKLNSNVTRSFSKIQSPIACICIRHFDIICLSETYLNSDISSLIKIWIY